MFRENVLGYNLKRISNKTNMTRALIMILIIMSMGFVWLEAGDSFFRTKEQDVCEGKSCPQSQVSRKHTENGNIVTTPASSSAPAHKEQEEINMMITFTQAVNNKVLQDQFTLTISSLMKHSSVPLVLHIIGEAESQKLAEKIIDKHAGNAQYRIAQLNVDELAHKMHDIVNLMQGYFSYKPGAYYNHALFFLSVAMHRIMPESMHKVIMMDADLKFSDDIKLLYEQFDQFSDSNVIGIAHEMQPVYRHAFWYHRNHNPGTRVGDPPPNGLTGFNSGVLLLNLDKMRKSEIYNRMLVKENLDTLVKEFQFKGHLGDQDFYSLLSMKHEELFYVLPCVFNYQLNTWWRDHGYQEVFHLYHTCEGDIKIYHGNGKSKIPDD